MADAAVPRVCPNGYSHPIVLYFTSDKHWEWELECWKCSRLKRVMLNA
jgi:hypothetical protein